MSSRSAQVSKVTKYTYGPKASDFDSYEQDRFDIDGVTRNVLKIQFSALNDATYFAMREIAKNQYALPMKYLKPVSGTFSYISQKAQLIGNEKDIRNASVTIEPLNPDINNIISYTPINQSMPIGTPVIINVSTEYNIAQDGTAPTRKFIWSSNLETDADIESKIKAENPQSITTKPWVSNCHYCAIDIGSKLTAKYVVDRVDTSIAKSFSMFSFVRCDDDMTFEIWVHKAYNVMPTDIVRLVSQQPNVSDDVKAVLNEILEKAK